MPSSIRAVMLAENARDRYVKIRPAVEQALRASIDREYRTKWADRFVAVERKVNAAAERFARIADLQAEIIAAFLEAQAVDLEAGEVNASAPIAEVHRVPKVEAAARGGKDHPSLLKETVLYDFDGRQIWPVKKPLDPALFQIDGRRHAFDCGPEWWRAGQEAAEAKAKADAAALAESDRQRKIFYGQQRP
jgi:hypothetical protein